MPGKTVAKQCACGCRSMTKGDGYLHGHDSKTLSVIIEMLECQTITSIS